MDNIKYDGLYEWYKNLPKDKKQKIVEYRKKILSNEKKRLVIIIRRYLNFKTLTF